jgi:hypothetical protein
LSSTAGILKILSDLRNSRSNGLSVPKLVVDLVGFGSLLGSFAGLALGLGDPLGELLHGGG